MFIGLIDIHNTILSSALYSLPIHLCRWPKKSIVNFFGQVTKQTTKYHKIDDDNESFIGLLGTHNHNKILIWKLKFFCKSFFMTSRWIALVCIDMQNILSDFRVIIPVTWVDISPLAILGTLVGVLDFNTCTEQQVTLKA